MNYHRAHTFTSRVLTMLLGFAAWTNHAEPVRYERIERTEPVSLVIHVLRVDLNDPRVTLHVAVGPRPPDGMDGEVLMTAPLELAQSAALDWAINTNPWRHPERGQRFPTEIGAPAMITGWAVTNGSTRSEPCRGCWEFWIDSEGKAQIGNVSQDGHEIPDARWAVGGFRGLLQDGELIPTRKDGGRAPRSALGLDRDHRVLTMVVVDKGVPAGFPAWREVMNHYELAVLMQELGCWTAYNLDGGGSSIMIRRVVTEYGDPLWVPVNRQSVLVQRPLPMLLGVRVKR